MPPTLIWPLLGSPAPYPMSDWWSCNTLHAPPQFPGAGDFQGALEGKGRFWGSTGTNWTPLSFVCSSDRSVASLLCRLKVWANRPVASGGRVSLSITAFQHPSPTFLSCGGCLGFCNNTIFQRLSSLWSSSWKFLGEILGLRTQKIQEELLMSALLGLALSFFMMARLTLG